jgi:hypothetical protein
LEWKSTKSTKESKMNRFKFSVIGLVLLIVGCASLDKEKENWMKFDETSRAYIRAIRWGEYEAAFGFKRLPNVKDELPDFNDLSDVRVTFYRVKQTIISENEMMVMQIVDFQYYRMRNVTVRTITDRQRWEYDKEQERWYLISDLPDFE